MSLYRDRGVIKATTPPERWAEIHTAHRVRYLPIALENTWRKLRELEAEAERIGLTGLLAEKAAFDAAWDREIEIAKHCARIRGQDYTMEAGL